MTKIVIDLIDPEESGSPDEWARINEALASNIPNEKPFSPKNIFSNDQIDEINRRFDNLKNNIIEAQRQFVLGLPLTSTVQLSIISLNAMELMGEIHEGIQL